MMNYKKILFTLLSCCFMTGLAAQNSFTLGELYEWTQGYDYDNDPFDDDAYYRLTTLWVGAGKSLDIINDDNDNKPLLMRTGKFDGQYWKITPIRNGYYRLTTYWRGKDKALGILKDGKKQKLILVDTAEDYSQFWKITPIENGYYRLTTLDLGEKIALDIVNDPGKNKLMLARTGKYHGQYWKFTKIAKKETLKVKPYKN